MGNIFMYRKYLCVENIFCLEEYVYNETNQCFDFNSYYHLTENQQQINEKSKHCISHPLKLLYPNFLLL